MGNSSFGVLTEITIKPFWISRSDTDLQVIGIVQVSNRISGQDLERSCSISPFPFLKISRHNSVIRYSDFATIRIHHGVLLSG